MDAAGDSWVHVRRADVEVLIGIAARVDGELKGGALDAEMAARLATWFVDRGHLERGEDGTLPSAGRVTVAMDNLIERLRFALGEYDSEPDQVPEATAHTLYFPTEASAAECKAELVKDAMDVLVVPEVDRPGWRLYAVYPELSPDPGSVALP
jgi:hypothetical protein